MRKVAKTAVVQARDELFVGRDPILLMVEPHSLVITGLYATDNRDAETWVASCCLPRIAVYGSRDWPKMAVFHTVRLAKRPNWMLPFRKMSGIH
jgi:hypothetical protein